MDNEYMVFFRLRAPDRAAAEKLAAYLSETWPDNLDGPPAVVRADRWNEAEAMSEAEVDARGAALLAAAGSTE